MNDLIQPKRWFLGRKLANENLEGQLLPKFIALPIFSSDALSSVAYGPQEMLLVLTMGGIGLLSAAPAIALVVVALLGIIVFSYRKIIKAYPSGGGDYEVAMKNLGKKWALLVASALLLDYVMTVTVSIASGTDNLISAFPSLNPWRVEIAVGFLIALCAVNLRGVRESGVAFAIPTYLFMGSVAALIVTGLIRAAADPAGFVSPSAHYEVVPMSQFQSITQTAMTLLFLRAFASGCSALTGIEAIANGVQAFRLPKIKNAQKTMLMMGSMAIFSFIGITALALLSKVHYAEDPVVQLKGWVGGLTNPQMSVMAQLGTAVFGEGSWMFYVLQAATAAVLLLAANTAFNGFPLLTSVLAGDKFAPKALLTRGDRLVYSNGMLSLTLAALVLLIAFQADVTRLIQLYMLGVFTSFTVGQVGMLRHWKRLRLKKTDDPNEAAMNRQEALSGTIANGLGAFMTFSVLVIVTATKFFDGAWMVFIIMPVLYAVMYYTHRYYSMVENEIRMDDKTVFGAKGDYAIVLMDKLNKPQLKALDYALSSRHTHLEVVHIAVDPEHAKKFAKTWKKYEKEIGVPLRILESPYREFSAPLIQYLQEHRDKNDKERISVYMPKLVVGHWWEHILHNHRAGRIRKQLMYVRGVMVTLVPWRLESAEYKDLFARRPLPGDSRRGQFVRPAPRRQRGLQNKVSRVRAKRIDED